MGPLQHTSSVSSLALCAFGGFTFRIGERWGFGRGAADLECEGVSEPCH